MGFRKFAMPIASKVTKVLVRLFPFLKKRGMQQFIKFGILSTVGTIITLSVLFLLTEVIGFYYMVSAVFAYILGVTTNFILNKKWTFLENLREQFLVKYGKYIVTSFVALGANLLALYMITEYAGLYYLLSQYLATGVSLMVNFIGNKIWIFRD